MICFDLPRFGGCLPRALRFAGSICMLRWHRNLVKTDAITVPLRALSLEVGQAPAAHHEKPHGDGESVEEPAMLSESSFLVYFP